MQGNMLNELSTTGIIDNVQPHYSYSGNLFVDAGRKYSDAILNYTIFLKVGMA